MQKKRTALMDLMDGRRVWDKLPHREPELTAAKRLEFEKRAKEYAEANPSDPFAKARKLLHLKRGLDD